MNLGLKTKLIFSYVALSVFLLLSIVFVSNYLFEKHFQNYKLNVQEQKNSEIVNHVLNEFVKYGRPSAEFLYTLGQNSLDNGVILMVTDKFGSELFCMSKIENVQSENMLESMKHTMTKHYPNWQGEYTETIYGLSKDDVNYGKVTLGYYGPFYYSYEDVYFIDMQNRIIKFIAVGFALISIVIGYYMALKISKPIMRAAEKTRQIKGGNFAERIDMLTNTKEIDKLISDVNSLADTLEQELKTKKRMANDYAHEFKTPLTTIQSNLEGMIDGILDTSPDRLESCRDEVLRLTRMIAEIDKIATMEREPVSLNKERLNLRALIQPMLVGFDKSIAEKNITIVTQLKDTYIFADKDKITQIILNLFTNALKYTDNGGTITIKLKTRGSKAILVISDTGIGIDEADLPYIFDHLYRTDKSRARATGGSGIGLSVVKAILNAHDADIDVKSRLGYGSEFTVSFNRF